MQLRTDANGSAFANFNNSVLLKADPEDPSKDWGNTPVDHLGWYKCVDGELVDN